MLTQCQMLSLYLNRVAYEDTHLDSENARYHDLAGFHEGSVFPDFAVLFQRGDATTRKRLNTSDIVTEILCCAVVGP
jgi:hypothetical protein